MDVPIYNLKGLKEGSLELPKVFTIPTRPDVIHRVYVALDSHRKQAKGTDPIAGERTSAESWGTGRGAARMARVKGGRHPTAGKAAGVGSVVGGRIIHPPKSAKKIRKEINRKERQLATASALSATANREFVTHRGHLIEHVPSIPVVVSDKLESVDKANKLRKIFEKLGMMEDLSRVSSGRKKKTGKAALRGRVHRTPRGPLIIVANDKGIGKAVGAFPGVECIPSNDINVLDLAPGSNPGRLTIWSESAFKTIPPGILKMGERFAS